VLKKRSQPTSLTFRKPHVPQKKMSSKKRPSDIASAWNTLEKKRRTTGGINSVRGESRVRPSHKQLLTLISHSDVPDRAEFVRHALELRVTTLEGGNGIQTYPSRPPPQLAGYLNEISHSIGKTPAWVVAATLDMVSESSLRVAETTQLALATTGAYLIEGIINEHGTSELDGVHMRHEYDTQMVSSQPARQVVDIFHMGKGHKRKHWQTTFILYVPQGGVFYTLFARNTNYPETLAPLPATYLRISRNGNLLSKGGFLSKILQVHTIMTKQERNVQVWKCFNIPDEMTRCVPDCWLTKQGVVDSTMTKEWHKLNPEERRKKWKERLQKSTTTKALCKQNVRACVFKNMMNYNKMYIVQANNLQRMVWDSKLCTKDST
jgi:hypothetical protein